MDDSSVKQLERGKSKAVGAIDPGNFFGKKIGCADARVGMPRVGMRSTCPGTLDSLSRQR
ncbi:hypothetical protein E2C01_068041 [Portunus trituberculatus]|uniref:Uncharacterized protein n=1 Tax=Portunus trituberculatus TaxID=210409 RepID=A0A5B7HZ12_PORTR|nr:hypothetical protein [Portunus trituberculatus]